MADKKQYGETLLTDFSATQVKNFLSKDAMDDLTKHAKPPSIALRALTEAFIAKEIKAGDTFTLTDLFLLMHKEGHERVKYKSLQTVLTRMVKSEDRIIAPVKIVGRQRGYQKT